MVRGKWSGWELSHFLLLSERHLRCLGHLGCRFFIMDDKIAQGFWKTVADRASEDLRRYGAQESLRALRAEPSFMQSLGSMFPQAPTRVSMMLGAGGADEQQQMIQQMINETLGSHLLPYGMGMMKPMRGGGGSLKAAGKFATKKTPSRCAAPTGDCFKQAAHKAHEVDGILVHGEVYFESTGRRGPHAWAEKGDTVFDPSTGSVIKKDRYYELVEAEVAATYPWDKGMGKMVREGNWGPWPKKGDIFRNTTDMPLYESALKKPDYYRDVKGLTVERVMMSPNEYINEVAFGWGLSPKKAISGRDNWSHLKEKVVRGARLEMPSVEYGVRADGTPGMVAQEGLHRAQLAIEMGIEEIPVLRAFNKVEPPVMRAGRPFDEKAAEMAK